MKSSETAGENMKIIDRMLEKQIEKWLFKRKIITVFGARQVGKTTMTQKLLSKYGEEQNYFNCDIPSIAARFADPEPVLLKRFFGDARLVVIDEAQRVKNIGMTLKIIHDTLPEVQVIATGSSSFSLGNTINEHLTGRGIEFLLYPFSLKELEAVYRPNEIDAQLSYFMRYGLYPEIVQKGERQAEILIENLASKYLYKDILELENLKKPELLTNLLQLLAFQIGSEVSRNELANKLGTGRETIERYLDLLAKTFVIYRLKPLARNQRNEIARKEKIYFYDLGVRNSIISSFQPVDTRNDADAMFENLMILERLKHLEYTGQNPNRWFWRTHDRKEIDYLEEHQGRFDAFEFKWKKGSIKKSVRARFEQDYPNTVFSLITRNNYFRIFENVSPSAN